MLPPVGVWAVSQSQCGRSPSQAGYWSSFTEQNIENYEHYFTQYAQIPEEEIPQVNDVSKFISTEISEDAGVDDFESFIKENIDPVMPIGMTFEDWYNKVKEIDGISDKEAVDIADTATSYLNKDLKDRETYE